MQVIARWKTGNATIQGRKHIIQMIVGGITQFLTNVQRMPAVIEKRLNRIIRGVLWNDKTTPPVSLDYVYLPVEAGGLGILDLEARSEAIDIMWLRAYLDFGKDRPIWAFLADDLLSMHVTKDCRPRQAGLRINPFLQKWKPRVHGLPDALDGMMKVARKYGVRLEGLAFSRNILRAMPMWDHAYADRSALGRLIVPSKLLTCLQSKHSACTVGEFEILASILNDATHRTIRTCKCTGCTRTRSATGCNNPHQCAKRAKNMLGTLPGKWNPLERQPEDNERCDWEELVQEQLSTDLVPFDRRVTTHGNLGHALRIFTAPTQVSNGLLTNDLNENGMAMTVATDGSCLNNGERNAQAGAGVFVELGHESNANFRLPANLEQSNQTAEITATLLAAQTADPHARLTIETDSQTTMDSLTRWRQRHEDTGYILQKNSDLTRSVVANLRSRKAHTIFKWIKGRAGHARNEAADHLAAEGAAKSTGDPLCLATPLPYAITGAKLQAMTQRLAYRAIRMRKDAETDPRPRTVANLDRIVSGLNAHYGVHLHDASVWSSLRSKHLSRMVSHFMWMVIHDAYMIGTHWLRPNMSDEMRARALCSICGECETMTHIMLECNASGQRLAWSLLKSTWELTGAEWVEPCWGSVFGAACIVLKTGEGGRRSSLEKLWSIICSETAHLIWRLRCERVIQNNGQECTVQEVTNRFYAALDSRLDLDRRTSALAKGKRALRPHDVERIWLPLLEDASNLPPKWVVDGGVLVGIRRGR